jgi:hypothetical protein
LTWNLVRQKGISFLDVLLMMTRAPAESYFWLFIRLAHTSLGLLFNTAFSNAGEWHQCQWPT